MKSQISPNFFKLDLDEEEILTEQEPIRFVLSLKDGGQRLDKLVAAKLSQYSRSRLQRWIEDGYITVNGKKAQAKQMVIGDEEICVFPQLAEEDLAFTPEAVEFPVVFEDKDILVVNNRPVWSFILQPETGLARFERIVVS